MNPVIDRAIWFGAGGALSYLTSIAIRKYGLRREIIAATVKDICEDLKVLSEKGAHYWVIESSSEKLPELEAQVSGINARVISLVGHVTVDLKPSPLLASRLMTDLFHLSDAATGGTFQVKDRSADSGRARLVQAYATALGLTLREAHRKTLVPRWWPWS